MLTWKIFALSDLLLASSSIEAVALVHGGVGADLGGEILATGTGAILTFEGQVPNIIIIQPTEIFLVVQYALIDLFLLKPNHFFPIVSDVSCCSFSSHTKFFHNFNPPSGY